MLKKLLSVFFIVFYMLTPCILANGGPGEGYPLSIGGNIKFINTPDIIVEREDLEIELEPRTSVVTAKYTLKNNGPAREISYIFPVTRYDYDNDYNYDYDYGEGFVESINFYDGNKKLEYSLTSEQTPDKPDDNDPYPGYSDKTIEINGEWVQYQRIKNSYYETKLSFATEETKILTVSYKANNSFESGGTSKSPLSFFSDVTFLYDLTPASAWGNGKAKEFNLIIDYNKIKYAKNIDINIDGFSRDASGIFKYSAKDFDFSKQELISAVFYYPFEVEEIKEGYPINNNLLLKAYVSSTLESKNNIYSANNLLDGNPNTIWSEGNSSNGIGEYIELLFNDAVNYYGFDVIGILNGYIKSEDLYYDNARIKKMRVEEIEEDYETKELVVRYNREVDFPDIPYYSIDKGNINYALTLIDQWDDSASIFRFTVLEVYPGRKYNDLCISEIYLFSDNEYSKIEDKKISEISVVENYKELKKSKTLPIEDVETISTTYNSDNIEKENFIVSDVMKKEQEITVYWERNLLKYIGIAVMVIVATIGGTIYIKRKKKKDE